MKVLIAGAGAVGGWLAAYLDEVTLLGRPALQEAVASSGLRVRGHTTFQGQPEIITEPDGHYDVAILTCKAHQTAALGAQVAPLADHLITLQNGLGNAEKLAALVGPERVTAALTSHGITVEAPGRLLHAGKGMFKVGPCPGSEWNERTDEALALFSALDPEACASMRGHIWQKAIINAGINPVGALHGIPNGQILGTDRQGLMEALVQEAAALAERGRVTLPPGDLIDAAVGVCQATADNKCSMLQDVEANRPTEIEQITGRMVRLGEALLASMPRSDFVYGRIKDLEASYLAPGKAEETAWQELEHIALTV